MPVAIPELVALTAQITSAYCANNAIEAEALPDLIRSVSQALASVGEPETAATDTKPPVPAVPIKRSVFPDYLVCLEDGKKLKMLKRHLQSTFGMTPADYRTRWGLPPDYPMVAPSYAERRSTLAKQIGLGRKTTEGDDEAGEPIEAVAEDREPEIQQIPAGRRGRRKKPDVE